MPAIGTVWGTGTWDSNAWALDTWEDSSAPVTANPADSPTFLFNSYVGTALVALNEDGNPQMNPLIFKAGETGPLGFVLAGVNGTVEDLTGASSCVLNVVSTNGTVLVAARALIIVSQTLGEVSWTRTAPDVATAGDYLMEVTVVRSDSTIGKFPDQSNGAPLTILPGLV